MKGKIVNTNIRLNLEREADRQAWEHLQRLDRKVYKSYSRAVVMALNAFFDRQADAKEDAFLQKLREIIHQELQGMAPALGLMQLLQGAAPATATPVPVDAAQQQEAVDAALDFIDSF